MLREQHVINEIHAYRYTGDDPQYALVISHGIASHGGIYDIFCCHHAARGVDIWAYDAPGHGQSTTNRPRGQWQLGEWVDASVMYAEHVKTLTGLLVFTLGSSLGVAAAYASASSDAVSGAILMGSPLLPGGQWLGSMKNVWRSPDVQQMLSVVGRAARLDCRILFDFDEDYGYSGASEQKRLDPWNTWSYDLSAWSSLFTYEPDIHPADNTKPILVACGGKDPTFSPQMMQREADAISGPVDFYCLDEGKHQLMLFHTEEFSKQTHGWVQQHI